MSGSGWKKYAWAAPTLAVVVDAGDADRALRCVQFRACENDDNERMNREQPVTSHEKGE